MVKCKSICFAILILVHYVPLVAISSPLYAERFINATYGHPLLETWRNASNVPFSRGPGLDIFAKFVSKPFPYGFIEFLRQGITAFHHRQSLPSRVTGYLRHHWNRMINFMPDTLFNETTHSYSTFLDSDSAHDNNNYRNNNNTNSNSYYPSTLVELK